MTIDKAKLKKVFEETGIDNSESIINSIETFVQEQVSLSTAKLTQEHTEELAKLNETFLQEKQNLIEAQLSEIEHNKSNSKELIETLIEENTSIQNKVDSFDKVQEDLVEFTINKLNEEFNERLEMFFAKVAEEWVEEKDNELEVIAEETAIDLGMSTIAEALASSGFDLHPSDESVASKLTELEESYSSIERENKILKGALKDIEKEVLIQESVEDLTDYDADKLRSIAEKMEFKNAESFKIALKFMQESLNKTPSNTSLVQEDIEVEPELDQVVESSDERYDDLIAATLSAMS